MTLFSALPVSRQWVRNATWLALSGKLLGNQKDIVGLYLEKGIEAPIKY